MQWLFRTCAIAGALGKIYDNGKVSEPVAHNSRTTEFLGCSRIPKSVETELLCSERLEFLKQALTRKIDFRHGPSMRSFIPDISGVLEGN